ncbi:MAG TPA: c-type cytochrome [Vicinamibacterales bacterium]|nr:c-type cytochrome [Vicinamibacterales bacterium]
MLGLVVLVVVLVLGAITAVGWQVVLGPNARPTSPEPLAVTPERLARGEYLAEGPAHCFHCHTAHDFSQPEYPILRERKGAGWVMPIPELNNIAAPNITPDPETGIGAWTDDQVARAIREGVRHDGTALFPVMPYMDYAEMDDEDVASIVVYLRTLTPVRHVVPARALPFPLEYIVKTMPKPLPASRPARPRSTPAERGAYLVTLAGCEACHTPADGGQPIPALAFGGGALFQDPGRDMAPLVTSNITSAPSGIAHYDEAFFIEVMRTGRMGGRALNHIMPFEFFRRMTDDDLRDVFAYLRAVPPVTHRVTNTDPPTACVVCDQSHGLGELNARPN